MPLRVTNRPVSETQCGGCPASQAYSAVARADKSVGASPLYAGALVNLGSGTSQPRSGQPHRPGPNHRPERSASTPCLGVFVASRRPPRAFPCRPSRTPKDGQPYDWNGLRLLAQLTSEAQEALVPTSWSCAHHDAICPARHLSSWAATPVILGQTANRSQSVILGQAPSRRPAKRRSLGGSPSAGARPGLRVGPDPP